MLNEDKTGIYACEDGETYERSIEFELLNTPDGKWHAKFSNIDHAFGDKHVLAATPSHWRDALTELGIGVKSEVSTIRLTPDGDFIRVEATYLPNGKRVVSQFKRSDYEELLAQVASEMPGG